MRPEEVEEIVTDYGAVLARRPILGIVRDIRSLPHPKAKIKEALKIALSLTDDTDMRQQLMIGFLSLADFQPLSNSEVDAIQMWNVGAGIPSASEIAIAIQLRVAEETDALAHELVAAGFAKEERRPC